jgi:hypothetical protein
MGFLLFGLDDLACLGRFSLATLLLPVARLVLALRMLI